MSTPGGGPPAGLGDRIAEAGCAAAFVLVIIAAAVAIAARIIRWGLT